MTVQYNVPIKVLDPDKEWMIQNSLQGYRVFTDRSGNLEGTCFSKENVPYVGEVVVIKTLKQEAAQTAREVLSGMEGLLVLPITECEWEEDQRRVAELSEIAGVRSTDPDHARVLNRIRSEIGPGQASPL